MQKEGREADVQASNWDTYSFKKVNDIIETNEEIFEKGVKECQEDSDFMRKLHEKKHMSLKEMQKELESFAMSVSHLKKECKQKEEELNFILKAQRLIRIAYLSWMRKSI